MVLNFICFLVILVIVHLFSMIRDKSFWIPLLLKFFMRFSPKANETFEKQIMELRECKYKAYFIDVDDSIHFGIKKGLVPWLPWIYLLVVSCLVLVLQNSILTIIVSVIFAVFNAFYYEYSKLPLFFNQRYYIKEETRPQKVISIVGMLLSAVIGVWGFLVLFDYISIFDNSIINAIISYILLLFSSLIVDFFREFASKYSKEYDFSNLDNVNAPLILYLRSFSIDSIKIYCPTFLGGGYLRYLLWPTIPFPLFVTNLLETTGSGVVIGIGNPNNISQFKNYGFSKSLVIDNYQGENKWKEEIKKLLPRVSTIVSVVGKTEGVSWELDMINFFNLKNKALMLFPPIQNPDEEEFELLGSVVEKFQITENSFPNEFYCTQFIGLSFLKTEPMWYLNYGRDFYSYIFTLLLQADLITSTTDPFGLNDNVYTKSPYSDRPRFIFQDADYISFLKNKRKFSKEIELLLGNVKNRDFISQIESSSEIGRNVYFVSYILDQFPNQFLDSRIEKSYYKLVLYLVDLLEDKQWVFNKYGVVQRGKTIQAELMIGLFKAKMVNVRRVGLENRIAFLNRLVGILRELTLKQQLSDMLYKLADAYYDSKNYSSCIRTLRECLELDEAQGLILEQIEVWNRLGMAYYEIKDFYNCKISLYRIIVLSKKINRLDYFLQALKNLYLVFNRRNHSIRTRNEIEKLIKKYKSSEPVSEDKTTKNEG